MNKVITFTFTDGLNIYTDKEMIAKAKESVNVARNLDLEEFIDPTILTVGPLQTPEWLGHCMDIACIAQQLYAEGLGWVE